MLQIAKKRRIGRPPVRHFSEPAIQKRFPFIATKQAYVLDIIKRYYYNFLSHFSYNNHSSSAVRTHLSIIKIFLDQRSRQVRQGRLNIRQTSSRQLRCAKNFHSSQNVSVLFFKLLFIFPPFGICGSKNTWYIANVGKALLCFCNP